MATAVREPPSAGPLAPSTDHSLSCCGPAGFLGGNYAYGFNGNEIFEGFFGTSNPFASIVEGTSACAQRHTRDNKFGHLPELRE